MSWERVDICSIWSACGKRLARNADLPMLLDGGEANSSLSLSLCNCSLENDVLEDEFTTPEILMQAGGSPARRRLIPAALVVECHDWQQS